MQPDTFNFNANFLHGFASNLPTPQQIDCEHGVSSLHLEQLQHVIDVFTDHVHDFTTHIQHFTDHFGDILQA